MIVSTLVLAASLGHASFWGQTSDPVAQPAHLFGAGQYAQVVAQFSPEALQRLHGDALRRAYLLLGQSLERLGRTDQALGVYQLGVKLFPTDLPLLTQLGSLLHRAGLEDRAEPLFQRVISIHPNNEAANLGLAEIDHALGFLDRSATHYEKALESDDSHPEMWLAYAEVLRELRDDKTAELAYRRSLELAPSPGARIGLAFALRAQGRLAEGIGELDKLPASAASPEARAQAAPLRALWLLEARRDAEALATVEPILADSPDEPLARYIRARVRLKQDRYGDAVSDLSVAARDSRRAPFVAQVARAMLDHLKGPR